MKIHTLTVKNFKLHRELQIDFDDRVTLIGGPNETGKSTLLEALRKVLFLRAKGQSEEHRKIRSLFHAGHPEVELVFSVGEATYTLKKCFSGATGTALLQKHGGTSWTGDAVESQLADILGLDQNKSALGQWSHLLIRQRHSGDDPSDDARDRSATLLKHLQADGGTAILQSDRDRRVAAQFEERANSIFQLGGNPKAGSDWAKAGIAEAETAEALAQARSAYESLIDAAKDYENATALIAAKTAARATLEPELLDTRKRLADAERLEAGIAALKIADATAAGEHKRLADGEASIAQTRALIESTRKTLAPLEDALKTARASLDAAEARDKDTEAAVREAATREEHADLDAALARGCLTILEKREAAKALSDSVRAIADLRSKVQTLETQLAGLPDIDEDTHARIQEAETAVATCQAGLDAIATKVSIRACDAPVDIGGTPHAEGGEVVLTEQTEIVIGANRLSIVPGGASGIQAAKEKLDEARATLRRLLAAHAVESASMAARVLRQRANLAIRLDDHRKTLKSSKASQLEARLAAIEKEIAQAEGGNTMLKARHPAFQAPDGIADATALLAGAERVLIAAKQGAKAADEARTLSRQELDSSRRHLDQCRTDFETAKDEVQKAEARLDSQLSIFGGDDERAAVIEAARQAAEKASTELEQAQSRLEQLKIGQLRITAKRLEDSLAGIQATLQAEGTRQAVAKSRIEQGGEGDPAAALARATVLHDTARKELEAASRKAAAIRLVHTLFQEQKAELARQYTQPFIDRIHAYLQCVLGAQATASIDLEGGGGLQVARPGFGNIAFDFKSLSGGAAEQTAAAARLAMAELLAKEHDGCLPMVFDDAFTNSDPARVRSILDMIYLASQNGLQIILLSCTPADYSGSGAKEILLPGHESTA